MIIISRHLARTKWVHARSLQYCLISLVKPRTGVSVRRPRTLTHLIYPAGENSTGLMGSGRVRRHPHRRN
jgi:hypothetical protein